MFGVVPKPLWERRAPADERNRIRLGMRPLLVRTGRQTVLIDAGIGDKMSEKEHEIYAIDRRPSLEQALAGRASHRRPTSTSSSRRTCTSITSAASRCAWMGRSCRGSRAPAT